MEGETYVTEEMVLIPDHMVEEIVPEEVLAAFEAAEEGENTTYGTSSPASYAKWNLAINQYNFSASFCMGSYYPAFAFFRHGGGVELHSYGTVEESAGKAITVKFYVERAMETYTTTTTPEICVHTANHFVSVLIDLGEDDYVYFIV